MNITLTTIGSRGDIQPYIALGTALQAKGHEITLATHPWAKDLLNSYNLLHAPVGDDIDIHYTAKQFVENAGNNLKGFHFALNFIFDRLRNCHSDFLNVLRDADLVIGHGIVGNAEADMLNKPFVTVSFAPMGLQKEYHVSANIIKNSYVYLGDKLKGFLFGKPYINFRKETGAPPLGSKTDFPYLAIVPISPLIQKYNPYWKPVTEVTGFFFADTPVNYTPSAALEKFIQAGEKPVLLTFGSMFHGKEETARLFDLICKAIDHSGKRALLLMPDLLSGENAIPGEIFLINDIPYSWLLSRVSMVIHHFGFGTTAEVLRAGLPSVPVPHLFDQKMRASQIYKMGLSTKPLDVSSLNSGKLSAAITRAASDSRLIKHCYETGLKISLENGTERAVELIEMQFMN